MLNLISICISQQAISFLYNELNYYFIRELNQLNNFQLVLSITYCNWRRLPRGSATRELGLAQPSASAEEPAFGAIIWGGDITCDVHVDSFSRAQVEVSSSRSLPCLPTQGAGLRASGGSCRPNDTTTWRHNATCAALVLFNTPETDYCSNFFI